MPGINEVVVRQAAGDDFSAIKSLLAQLNPNEPDSFSGEVRQGWKGFVAERDGRVVGFLLATFTDYGISYEASGVIEQLVIDEAHRDAGAGRELVAACCGWLASEGIHMVFVSTADGTDTASFYERCGFERCRGPWLGRPTP